MGKGLACTISLDKSAGIVVRIEGDKTTQTIRLDGTTLTLEVAAKGSAGSSKITQTTDAVTIDCKTFTVNASANVVINAGEALQLAGTSGAELSGATVKLEADGMATLKGSLTLVQGQVVKVG
jgi:phage gp45-like